MDARNEFFVQGADGRKFKMVIRGDLGKLSVGKIRRYLGSYGVSDTQLLYFNGMPIQDDAVGKDFGLYNNAVLQLVSPTHSTDAEAVREGLVGKANDLPSAMMRENRNNTPPSAMSTESREELSQNASLRPQTAAVSSYVDPESDFGIRSQLRSGFANTYNSSNNTNVNEQKSSGLAAALEVENLQLRDEVHRLRQELADMRGSGKGRDSSGGGGGGVRRQSSPSADLLYSAKANLQELGEELGIPLQFDMNLTSVIGTDERHMVLVTFDHATERLYVYSTLLTQLPEDAAVRVKLYELLLEGSLLGREVCGGGIGMSLQNGIVMLSTTIPLRHCSSSALKETMPSFVETVERWRALINELLE
ncbi:hypothetical protein DQ04_02321100 [Trypanosoma grayi]|uniref:hypothetical protein n=1 Tax=Trypanosoma grayi TaxID=71804 RepID=UPI0004F46CD3|nr:hypothetical protein DQ04_02321100 [Trypanosoma grayi]KEG11746.1 hypothetical protein DQ04_02321100 [Trypanosoma grayi]